MDPMEAVEQPAAVEAYHRLFGGTVRVSSQNLERGLSRKGCQAVGEGE